MHGAEHEQGPRPRTPTPARETASDAATRGRGLTDAVLALQRTAGNRATSGLLGSPAAGPDGAHVSAARAGRPVVQRQRRARVDPNYILDRVFRDARRLEAVMMIYARALAGEPLQGVYPYSEFVTAELRRNPLFVEVVRERSDAVLERIGARARAAPAHLHHWYVTFVERHVTGPARRPLLARLRESAAFSSTSFLQEAEQRLLGRFQAFTTAAWVVVAPSDSLNEATPDSYTIAAYATTLKVFRRELLGLLRTRLDFEIRPRYETETSPGTTAAIAAVRRALEDMRGSPAFDALRDAGPSIVGSFDGPYRRLSEQAIIEHTGVHPDQARELAQLD